MHRARPRAISSAPCQPAPLTPGVPIANENRLVVPDAFGHNDQEHKLGYLETPARMAPAGSGQRNRCCGLYRVPAAVTCLEICGTHPALPAANRLPGLQRAGGWVPDYAM
jgi:hypothetical protein